MYVYTYIPIYAFTYINILIYEYKRYNKFFYSYFALDPFYPPQVTPGNPGPPPKPVDPKPSDPPASMPEDPFFPIIGRKIQGL
jgi:hypothetical protein